MLNSGLCLSDAILKDSRKKVILEVENGLDLERLFVFQVR